MKVTPVASPQAVQNAPAKDFKAKAIEAFNRASQPANQGQSAPIPVNANAIAAEDMTAIVPPTQEEDTVLEASEAVEGGQTDTVEDTQEQVVEPKKDDSTNPHVILARRERALRAKQQQQEQQWKAREAALAEREAKLQAQQPDLSQYIPKAKLKANAMQVLSEEGISYEQLTQMEIERGQVPQAVQAHLDRLEARLAKQDEELTAFRKGTEEQQGEAYKAAVRQIDQDVRSLVYSDPEFEMIKATNSSKDVTELIEATFKEEGRVMSVEEAAREVEQHLLEEIEKLTRIEKIKKRIAAKPAAESKSNVQTPQTKQPQPMKTLTNATSSTRQLSAKERAILAFKGELGKG